MSEIERVASVVVAVTNTYDSLSAAAFLHAAIGRVENVRDDAGAAMEESQNPDAQEAYFRMQRAARFLTEALGEVMQAEVGARELVWEWGVRPESVVNMGVRALPGYLTGIVPSSEQDTQEQPAQPDASGEGTPMFETYYSRYYPYRYDDQPTPRLSSHDMFSEEIRRRLDTPIEQVLELGGDDVDAANRRSVLSQLRRSGAVTARDAIMMGPYLYKIHGVQLDAPAIMQKLQDLFPELDIARLVVSREDIGALAAQCYDSLDKIPVQILPSYREDFTGRYDPPITMADIIDPTTGEPYVTDNKYYYREQGRRPPRLPFAYEKLRPEFLTFVHRYRRTRHELYGEDV